MYTPERKSINFDHDHGYCEGMLYVVLIKTIFVVIMIHKVRKQFKGYTNKELDKYKLAHELKGIVSTPIIVNKRI